MSGAENPGHLIIVHIWCVRSCGARIPKGKKKTIAMFQSAEIDVLPITKIKRSYILRKYFFYVLSRAYRTNVWQLTRHQNRSGL